MSLVCLRQRKANVAGALWASRKDDKMGPEKEILVPGRPGYFILNVMEVTRIF